MKTPAKAPVMTERKALVSEFIQRAKKILKSLIGAVKTKAINRATPISNSKISQGFVEENNQPYTQ